MECILITPPVPSNKLCPSGIALRCFKTSPSEFSCSSTPFLNALITKEFSFYTSRSKSTISMLSFGSHVISSSFASTLSSVTSLLSLLKPYSASWLSTFYKKLKTTKMSSTSSTYHLILTSFLQSFLTLISSFCCVRFFKPKPLRLFI